MQSTHTILKDLEESIKRTITSHSEVHDATWRNLNDRLNHATTLSVYCDCSVITAQYHFGVCIAGLHTCKLFGSSMNTRFPEHTVLREIQALEFAIDCIERFVSSSKSDAIKSIALFSDVQHVQRLLNSNPQRLPKLVSEAVRQLLKCMNQFSGVYPAIRLRINFLGNTAQRENIFYKTAHKVARRVGNKMQTKR